jgi:antitoxin VapB
MSRARTKVFKTNKSQAVRLPKAVELPAAVRDVEITVVGHSRLISPAGRSWDAFFKGPRVSEDFMESRDQPQLQDRKAL